MSGQCTVEVLYRVDGNTLTDTFTAGHASVKTFDGGHTVLGLRDGRDETGPVDAVHYEHAYRVLRRPAPVAGKQG